MGRAVHGRTVVVGVGDTGLACARHLDAHGVGVALADSRAAPPREAEARRALPGVEMRLGGLEREWFEQAVELVLSPGVSPRQPAVAGAVTRGVPVLGEVELFARMVRAPVAAVTGTNGKSTVCAWVHAMAVADGRQAALGGNFGPPALALLTDAPELYVVELSSFQLETTRSLRPRVAALLNVSPDHLDRYDGFEDYRAAKVRIFRGGAGRGDLAGRSLARGVGCPSRPRGHAGGHVHRGYARPRRVRSRLARRPDVARARRRAPACPGHPRALRAVTTR